MYELIQELKFFDKKELKYLNEKIDLMEFSDSQVGFLDNPRVDKSVRSNTEYAFKNIMRLLSLFIKE